MGFLSGLLGGGKTSTTNTTTSDPYGPSQDALERIGALANRVASNRGKLNFYGGYTPLDPLQREALGGQADYARGLGAGVIDPATASWRSTLDPGMNPYLGEAQSALADRFVQDMNLSVLPGLRTSATLAGHEGGSTRKNLTEGVATGLGLQGLARAQADMQYQGYQDALQQQRFGLGALPMMLEAGQMPSQMLYGVGEAYRGEDEMARQVQQARSEFYQDEPYLRASRALSLAHPLAGVGGTTTGTQTVEKPGMSPLQAGLGIASLAGSFFGAPTAALGAAGAGAGGVMSPSLWGGAAQFGGGLRNSAGGYYL